MCGRVSVPLSYPMTAGAVWFQLEHIGGYAHRVSRVRRQEGSFSSRRTKCVLRARFTNRKEIHDYVSAQFSQG